MKLIKKLMTGIAGLATMFSMAACNNTSSNTPSDDTPTSLNGSTQTQTEFEESYIKGTYTYSEGGKFAMSILSNIGSIAGGVAFSSPTSCVSGVFGILTSINDQLNGSSGPTIATVMNKLNEMDTKLDEINDKLDKNYNQLATESIRTQAMVDQVLLEEQEQAIAGFNTDYIVPIENYQRDFSDYIEQSYKAYINSSEEADIHVFQDNNEWYLNSLLDQDQHTTSEIKFTIPTFSKSKAFLEANYNVVTEGFIDKVNEDIDAAMTTVTLPAGLEKETCRNFVAANIVENFTKKYYEDNHQQALNLRNMVINYAKQLTGKSAKSVMDRYVSRMEYMYNFAGEMKPSMTDLTANLLHTLDINTALASQACLYAGSSQEEVRSEYLYTKELLQTYYDKFNNVSDNYCFVTNSCISGGFYRSRFETSYYNKGNNCQFSSTFRMEKVKLYGPTATFITDDINAHNYLDTLDHLRIATRMNLMKQAGLTNAASYAEYLAGANVLPAEAYEAYLKLVQIAWITDDAYRFLTGVTIRDMNDGDKNFTMTCNDNGNPGGDYFNVGWKGTFRSGHDSSKWSGKIAETAYIDGKTGQIMDEKKVCAYATYNESHFYWVNDEHWSFLDNPVGNYYFILENVNA